MTTSYIDHKLSASITHEITAHGCIAIVQPNVDTYASSNQCFIFIMSQMSEKPDSPIVKHRYICPCEETVVY